MRIWVAAFVVGLLAVASAQAETVTYTYDVLGRVSTVTYANGTKITYTYDLGDNRLTQTVTCGTSGC